MNKPEQKPITYSPEIFELGDFTDAKQIVLTQENGVGTDERWNSETPWILSLLENYTNRNTHFLDFGCGVGRLSEPLTHKCKLVLGVDASKSMRKHAIDYVSMHNFSVVTPNVLESLVSVGTHFDVAISIWVLQHCMDPIQEITLLYDSLVQGGVLMVADMNHRAIPTNIGWVNDGLSVWEMLKSKFEVIDRIPFSAPNSPQDLVDNAYVALFKKV